MAAIGNAKREVRFTEDAHQKNEGTIEFYENGSRIDGTILPVIDWKQSFTSEIEKTIVNLSEVEWRVFLQKEETQIYGATFEEVQQMIQNAKKECITKSIAQLDLLYSARTPAGSEICLFEDLHRRITTVFGSFDFVLDQSNKDMENLLDAMAKMPATCLLALVKKMQRTALPMASDIKEAMKEVNEERELRLSGTFTVTSVKPPRNFPDSKSSD